MPRDSNGNTSPFPGTIVNSGDTILPSQHNPMVNDVYAMMSQSLSRDGQGGMRAPLNMSGFSIINVGESALPSSPARNSDITELSALIRRYNPAGKIMIYRGKTAPAGWILENGGTIGNSSSGATTRANADTLDLYVHLWNTFGSGELSIQTSAGAATTRGATAIADFNAGKRLFLFNGQNRYPRAWVSGLTVGQVMDDSFAEHTHAGTIPPHTHIVPSRTRAGYSSAAGSERIASVNAQSLGTDADPMTTSGTSLSFTTAGTGGDETRPKTSVYLFLISL